MIKWKTTHRTNWTIEKIARRALKMFRGAKMQDVSMDITATHLNGTPLNLEKLLNFDDFNFAHDIQGIMRHIDRDTGRLKDHFLPRSFDSLAVKLSKGGK